MFSLQDSCESHESETSGSQSILYFCWIFLRVLVPFSPSLKCFLLLYPYHIWIRDQHHLWLSSPVNLFSQSPNMHPFPLSSLLSVCLCSPFTSPFYLCEASYLCAHIKGVAALLNSRSAGGGGPAPVQLVLMVGLSVPQVHSLVRLVWAVADWLG